MDSLRTALTWVKDLLDWLPDPVVALLILGIVVLVALALHRWARKLVRRTLSGRYPFIFSVFTQTRGLTKAALLILAMMVAVPVAPLPPDTAALLARLMAVAVIGLIGWAAIIALHIAADLYLRRFRLDSDDNLLARKHNTQVRVLARTIDVLLVMLTLSAALMTFPAVRQYGVSLFASAGVAGIVAGLAARPVLSNLMAGVQLAMTQPIRLYDAVIVENEYGTIEEITSTYVVVKLWDLRRMIVPLTYFIEKPFQNWTRESSSLVGNVMLYLDYSAPVDIIREKFNAILKESKRWDGQVCVAQVTDFKEGTMELRLLMSARSSGQTFDLRCEVREKLIDFLQREHPEALPHSRQIAFKSEADAATESERLGRKAARNR
ncbi:MAG TPA: mechanosensitive ion channel family protein [Pseudolabrys sp.]|jgi:small-conductance mechanosensitive channel|nr:mechanosensitive ion channel family protein [Pseudolabrys sp.]